MRPAKFFLGLLLAAAVLITFLKILLFFVTAALVLGTLFFAGRAFWYLGGRRQYQLQRNYGNWVDNSMVGNRQSAAEPLDPNYRRRFRETPFARQIEVV